MSITVKEVAEAAGLSEPTVSHILSGRGARYRESTQVRVRQIAQQLGYRPNAAARATRTGRFDTVGVMAGHAEIDNSLFSELIRGVLEELEPRGLNCLISSIGPRDFEGPPEQRVGPRLLRKMHIDGMIVNCSATLDEQAQALILRQPMPAVWVNAKLDANCVYPDDHGGACALTRHLIELGHRRIAFIGQTDSTHFSVGERRRGYAQTMQEAGLTPDFAEELPRESRITRKPGHFAAWLDRPGRPSAVICYGGGDANPMITACLGKGLRLGHDLSLGTFSVKDYTASGLRLTTAVIPARAVGSRAAHILHDAIETGERGSIPAVAIPESVTIGPSSGPSNDI